MLSCAFFGHELFNYGPYQSKTYCIIENLIKLGVTKFYNLYKGNFDFMCAHLVNRFRDENPQISHVLVLPNVPAKNFVLPSYFDKSICLSLEKVASTDAFSYINHKLIENVDYIVSGVTDEYDLAKISCDYAELLCKPIIYLMKNYF